MFIFAKDHILSPENIMNWFHFYPPRIDCKVSILVNNWWSGFPFGGNRKGIGRRKRKDLVAFYCLRRETQQADDALKNRIRFFHYGPFFSFAFNCGINTVHQFSLIYKWKKRAREINNVKF
jgi:hypothetical protein